MLSKEIDIFEIQLDNSTATYTPGDKVLGKLILLLNSHKSLRALKLRFKGECKIYWNESRGMGSDSETHHYDGTENYFKTDICLIGSADGDTIKMKPGHYVYPFSYNLPYNIPSSYKHAIGNICYSIEGIIDRVWRIDDRVKQIITVEAPLQWEPIEENGESGIDHEIEKSFCCGVLGKTLVRMQIPNTIFECGDRIEATISVRNKSGIGVKKIVFKLEEVLDFHSTSLKDKTSEIETIKKVEDSGPFSKNTEVKLSLEVPQLPFSFFKYCKLIDRNYRMNISVHYSGCHRASRKTYSIVIGSRSPMPTLSCSELSSSSTANYSTSEALQVPSDEHFCQTELSSQIPVGYINSLYPPSVFAGPYPSECNDSQDIGFVSQHQPPDKDTWDEASPPPYHVAVACNQGKIQ